MPHPLELAHAFVRDHAPDDKDRAHVLRVLTCWLETNADRDVRACRDCGGTFWTTPGQRAWYERQGLPEPVRCPDCRAARRAMRER
jgi:hypothetical protein